MLKLTKEPHNGFFLLSLSPLKLYSSPIRKNFRGAGEMVQELRVLAAFPED